MGLRRGVFLTDGVRDTEGFYAPCRGQDRSAALVLCGGFAGQGAGRRVTAREICFVGGFGFAESEGSFKRNQERLMISASSKRSRCWPLAKDDHAAAWNPTRFRLCACPVLRTHGCLVIVIGFLRQRSSHRIYVAILMLPDPFGDIDIKGKVCRQS